MPRILLVKTSSMGDVVHNLPILADINARVTDASFHWVVEEAFADIPAMHPLVSRVIPVATRRWRKRLYRLQTWKEIAACKRLLRQEPYDYIIDSQGLLKSAIFAHWARGPVYGMDRDSAREGVAARFYHHAYAIPTGRHAVIRNRELAARVFAYSLPETAPDYGIMPDSNPDTGLDLPEKYIACLHGSSRSSKLWPEQSWRELAELFNAHGIDIVLPWGNAEEQQRANMLRKDIKGAIVLPKLDLKSLACILQQARAVVGVDTGLVHLATALKCPTIGLYLDTSPALTGVLGQEPRIAVSLGDRGRTPKPAEVIDALQAMEVLT